MLAFKWDCTDFEEEEPTRPEFVRNPATVQKRGFHTLNAGFMPLGTSLSPYFAPERRATRLCRAALVTAWFMAVVCAGTLALLAFRIFLAHDAYFQREFRQICISFGWQANGTAAATAGTNGDHGDGEAEPTFMGVSIPDPNPNPNPNSPP